MLDDLAERWHLAFAWVIPRGSVSVVIRCARDDGRACVLKVSPDRERVTREAVALRQWHTVHAPSVLAVDASAGALLLEAIEPGTPLDETGEYPALEKLAALLSALHSTPVPEPSYPSVAQRVAYLYDASSQVYRRSPWLVEIIPPEVYERGRQRATLLAEQSSVTVLLHGDLTPRNILTGDETRGLVAIDPAPCVGDPAFDTVDLLLWQADDFETVVARAAVLAPALGVNAALMLDWCTSFAAMTALELAESDTSSRARCTWLVALAARA